MSVCFVEELSGCTGALAREVLKAFPSSSVTVFDLPHVVEMAQKHFAQDDDNIAFQAGERLQDRTKRSRSCDCVRRLKAWSSAMTRLPVAHRRFLQRSASSC